MFQKLQDFINFDLFILIITFILMFLWVVFCNSKQKEAIEKVLECQTKFQDLNVEDLQNLTNVSHFLNSVNSKKSLITTELYMSQMREKCPQGLEKCLTRSAEESDFPISYILCRKLLIMD